MVATRSVVVAAAVVGAVTLGVAACTTADRPRGSSTPHGSTAAVHGGRTQSEAARREPARSRRFALVVTMGSGTITTNVTPISASSNAPVDPPHDTAAQWNTAVWVQQSTYPSTPGRGTTYVYGHACHYHVCPFTNLKDAHAGDSVRVTTTTRTSTYTIDRVGLSPKSASSLPPWASDSTEPDRLVLVTCAYEHGDTSTNNIVVLARLNQ